MLRYGRVWLCCICVHSLGICVKGLRKTEGPLRTVWGTAEIQTTHSASQSYCCSELHDAYHFFLFHLNLEKKEVIDCKSAQCGKLKKNAWSMFIVESEVSCLFIWLFWKSVAWVPYVRHPGSLWYLTAILCCFPLLRHCAFRQLAKRAVLLWSVSAQYGSQY